MILIYVPYTVFSFVEFLGNSHFRRVTLMTNSFLNFNPFQLLSYGKPERAHNFHIRLGLLEIMPLWKLRLVTNRRQFNGTILTP